MLLNKELKYSLGLYLVIVSVFIYFLHKNPKLFSFNKKFKDFGTGKDKTVLPPWLIFIYGAFIVYIVTIIFII